jgi:hypothetical protein
MKEKTKEIICRNKQCEYNVGFGEGRCERQKLILDRHGNCTNSNKKNKDKVKSWEMVE